MPGAAQGAIMKRLIVKEYDVSIPNEAAVLDLSQKELKQCLGCWTCWWTTPGRCVHQDLNEFYSDFLAADQVTIYCGVSQGFVSSNMKALIDRMIVFVLPYISWDKGESCHEPRYENYPAVHVIYRGDFLPGEEEAFVAYWERTLDMLFIKDFSVTRDADSQEAQL